MNKDTYIYNLRNLNLRLTFLPDYLLVEHGYVGKPKGVRANESFRIKYPRLVRILDAFMDAFNRKDGFYKRRVVGYYDAQVKYAYSRQCIRFRIGCKQFTKRQLKHIRNHIPAPKPAILFVGGELRLKFMPNFLLVERVPGRVFDNRDEVTPTEYPSLNNRLSYETVRRILSLRKSQGAYNFNEHGGRTAIKRGNGYLNIGCQLISPQEMATIRKLIPTG
jgi:hypothetical protein